MKIHSGRTWCQRWPEVFVSIRSPRREKQLPQIDVFTTNRTAGQRSTGTSLEAHEGNRLHCLMLVSRNAPNNPPTKFKCLIYVFIVSIYGIYLLFPAQWLLLYVIFLFELRRVHRLRMGLHLIQFIYLLLFCRSLNSWMIFILVVILQWSMWICFQGCFYIVTVYFILSSECGRPTFRRKPGGCTVTSRFELWPVFCSV